jgi:mono/diheme cytochrome c family protein
MSAGIRKSWVLLGALLPLVLLVLVVGGILFKAQGGFATLHVPREGTEPVATDSETVARGEYLAQLGNCITCHTVRGSQPFTGGRAFRSSYGTLYSTNLTPDKETGIGDWSVEEFRHAMRHGVSRNGLLYPAFPFANFTQLDEGDIDAIFAYLRQIQPIRVEPKSNELEFPASQRAALIAWRMLYHRPAPVAPTVDHTDPVSRGRYLVDGLGHCAMCHSKRGSMASLPADGYLVGTQILGQNWYAPALDQKSLADWSIEELAEYLRTGVSSKSAAYGPMAEVIYTSLRHLSEKDAIAIASYLKTVPSIPRRVSSMEREIRVANAAHKFSSPNGKKIYEQHCVDCHQSDGRGRGRDYPPLAGNSQVSSDNTLNNIRVVLSGGVPPTTAGNPNPHSMPPFAEKLSDQEIADVLNYIRSAWGNDGLGVTLDQVRALRGSTLD